MLCEPYNDIEYLHQDDVIDLGSTLNAVRTITYDRAKVDFRKNQLIESNIAVRLKRETQQ
jgi:hypoxanthine-guanine phosphoribosyltransferase